MPISADAIDRYLGAPLPHVPKFKGMREDWLYDWIDQESGAEYYPRSKPWQHQLEGLAFALWARKAMLLYGMRLGKTRISLEWASLLRAGGKWRGPGLVIAHAPIGLDVWEGQIKKFAPELRAAFVQNNVYEFMDALDQNYDLIVTPWTGLQNMFSFKGKTRKGEPKRIPDRVLLRMAADFFDLCIMDEIHMCKNHLSLRFQIAAELTARCRYRLALTGTPLGRSGYALWAQAFLTDRGKALGHNYFFFEQAFGKQHKNWFARGGKEWKFDKSLLPDLRHKIKPLALSYALEEVREVDVRPAMVRLRMRGDQREGYRKVVEDVIKLRLDEQIEIKNHFLRLRQIASGYLGFADDDGNRHVIDYKSNVKLEWLAALAENWDGESSIVVFHEFTHTGELITKMLEKQGIKHAWFYGGTKEPTRELRAFESGKVKWLVANTAKGGVGIDLSAADYMIFYESPVTPIVRAQAEARPLAAARGTRPLMMDDLVCAPIEDRIIGFIKEGREALSALMSNRKSLRLEG